MDSWLNEQLKELPLPVSTVCTQAHERACLLGGRGFFSSGTLRQGHCIQVHALPIVFCLALLLCCSLCRLCLGCQPLSGHMLLSAPQKYRAGMRAANATPANDAHAMTHKVFLPLMHMHWQTVLE